MTRQRPHRRRSKLGKSFIAGQKEAMTYKDWHKLWINANKRKERLLYDREAMKKPDFAKKLREVEREESIYAIKTMRQFRRESGRTWLDSEGATAREIAKYRWRAGYRSNYPKSSRL